MSLEQGAKLGAYEIVSPIGSGGMGEVYRARDTKLGRDVAIKVLPDELAKDRERLARFEREAKILAQLNHPNVATLYGFENGCLVMELVEGETLAERIASGPVPVEEALLLFIEIAEGLEAAHERGVIHRDLKPANVKITPEGKVKILDFGLAKALADETPDVGLSESPTVTRGTAAGVILGTAPYMSPEQARGKDVDKRTDIWAFGCCLYETLTGRAAFRAETVSDTLAAVLKTEPDLAAVPTPLRRVVRRCLQKNADSRLHDIADARLELNEPVEETEPTSKHRTPVFVMGVVALLATVLATWGLRTNVSRDAAVVRSSIPLAPGHELVLDQLRPSLAISPDGRFVAYVAREGEVSRLFVRALHELSARPVEGSEGASMPFFSPDSRSLAFLVDGKLAKASVSEDALGAPVTVAAIGQTVRGASWGTDGSIVYNRHFSSGLSRLHEVGGEPDILTTPAHEAGEKTHRFPQWLPEGRGALFTLGTGDLLTFDEATIAFLDPETREYRRLMDGGTFPHYVPTGHIIYVRAGTIYGVPFDLGALDLRGAPIPLVDGVATAPQSGHAELAVAGNGTLVYAPGGSWGMGRRVVAVNRRGETETLVDTPNLYVAPRISPDGSTLVLDVEGANQSIWLYDLSRGVSSRFTFRFDSGHAVWSPRGDRVAFGSNRAGSDYEVYVKSLDAAGEAQPLTSSARPQNPFSWSPDGRVIAGDSVRAPSDIWVMPADGSEASQSFIATPFDERRPVFSPDGRLVAYESNESGRYEIYLCRFPSGTGKRQVSTTGGEHPRWNRDGRELFYRSGAAMMVADVELGDEPVLGKPRVLFEKPTSRPDFDVDVDGQRFFMIEEGETDRGPTELVLVLNWTEELKRLVR